MATLVQAPKLNFNIEDLCNTKYPHIAIIKTFTKKSLVCRLDFKKTTVDKIIENLVKKIGYNLSNLETEKITLIHNKKVLEKNKTLADLDCSAHAANFDMYYDSSGNVTSKNKEVDLKTLQKKVKDAKDVLFVKTLTGKTIRLKYTNELQIIELKYLIFNKVGIPVSQQRLIFCGNQLEDNAKLFEYKIKNESKIHLVSRLLGGMFHETSGKNGNYKPLEFMIIDIDHEDISENVSSVQFDI
jgi:hypothetical protein